MRLKPMSSMWCILKHSDLLYSRFSLVISSLLWSLMLFWPGDTFSRPTYSLMGNALDEHIWASLFLIHSLVGSITLSTGKVNPVTFALEGVLGCLIWTSSCLMMLFSVYPPPAAISAEIVMAFTSWWILIRYPLRGRR